MSVPALTHGVSGYEVAYWEDGRVQTVLICRAKSERAARERADALMPDAVFLTIRKLRGRG